MSRSPLAHIAEIRRYPVKSMGGESLTSCTVTPGGVAGDRVWAVCDEHGEIKSARQWPRLLEFGACFTPGTDCPAGVTGTQVPEVTIHCPDGSSLSSHSTHTAAALGTVLGKKCSLQAVRAASERSFYRHPRQRDMAEIERELDRLPDEGELDFSQTPEDLMMLMSEYQTPPGTFFDIFPLHLLSTQALEHLGATRRVDARAERFRPNLLLDFTDPDDPLPEFGLVGSALRIGELTLRPRARTIRCGIPSRAQPRHGITAEREMTRAIVELLARHLGVYATIEGNGTIQVGDPVFLA